MKTRYLLFALVVALVLAGATPASAGTLDWTVSGDGISGSGTLVLGTEVSLGVFEITSITGTFMDSINGITGNVTDPYLIDGYQDTSPDGLYYFDNLLSMPSTGNQWLDANAGLLFQVGGGVGSPNGAEVNIAGAGALGSGQYQLWETSTPGSYLPPSVWPGYSAEFSISGQSGEVPEPVSFILLGSGLFLVGIVHRRRRA